MLRRFFCKWAGFTLYAGVVSKQEVSIGDPSGLAEHFRGRLRHISQLLERAEVPTLQLGIDYPNVLLPIVEELRGALAEIDTDIASIYSQWSEMENRSFDEAIEKWEEEFRYARTEVWREIRSGFDDFVSKCRAEQRRPPSWSAWATTSWAGDRMNSSYIGDQKIFDNDPGFFRARDIDPRRGDQRTGRPLGDTSLLAEYRDLHALRPHTLPEPPQRGVTASTGAKLPKGLFKRVSMWHCSSGSDRRCSSPWNPHDLDRWIDQNYGSPARRYRSTLRCLSDEIQKRLSLEPEGFEAFSDEARTRIDHGDDDAVRRAIDSLQTHWSFTPGPYLAPRSFVFACPNWRRCFGVLRPTFVHEG